MPGFLETTLHQGYDYLTPYVEKYQPYVEKVRNNVPLVDPALRKAEELVPVLITRADELAEPHVEKMRPYVEPRIEQVKEKVTPYVDGGVRYYNVGLEKVEQAKGFKDAKVEQAKGFKDARETQIRGFTDPKVEMIKEFKAARVTQIKEFTDPKVEMIKEFKEARVSQIHEFTDPKVEKIKEFKEAKTAQIREFTDPKLEKIKTTMEPQVACITARKEKVRNLLRVPASLDLQGLKLETLMGKVASGLEKVEAIVDTVYEGYLTEEQKRDNDSDSVSSASDSSCVRINRSVVSIMTRVLFVFMLQIKMLFSLPLQLKTMYADGTLKSKLYTLTTETKFILTSKVTEKLAPMVKKVRQTSLFKKVVQLGVLGSEKAFGKEKTTTLLSKAETFIPAAWKAAPPPEKKKKKN